MIDARDQLMSPSTTTRRRPAKVSARRASAAKKALRVERVFSSPKVKPFDQIEWDKRIAEITDDSGKTIFKQENVEVPKNWSLLATKVVCSKYFYGDPQKAGEREHSVKQLIHRVTRTITDWGIKDGYFSEEDSEVFYDELTWLCVNQYGAFNSPVWFNVGLYHEYGVGKNSDRGNWLFGNTALSRGFRNVLRPFKCEKSPASSGRDGGRAVVEVACERSSLSSTVPK